jgi:hypothetical protein
MKKWFLIFCLLIPLTVFASENKTERAIMHIITKGFPALHVYPRKNHPLKKDIEKRKQIVEAIDFAHQKYPLVPNMLLVTIAFRENSFLTKKVGALGEKSTFQMTKGTAKAAKKIEPECDLSTYKGSALCAAAWLDHWARRCGSLEGALTIYATGHSCKPKTRRVDWIVFDRMRLTKKLEALSY